RAARTGAAAARLPRLRGARLVGARDRHRLGRAAEGGVLVRRALRDDPAEHGMGRHARRRRERARRRRSRAPRRGRARRSDAGAAAAALRRRERLPSCGDCARDYASAVLSLDHVAIVGAGYVGMPHAETFANAGKRVVLVDVVEDVVAGINRGESHIADVPSERLRPLVESGAIRATTDFGVIREVDAVVIAVPTPLTKQREPDMSYIEEAARAVAPQ